MGSAKGGSTTVGYRYYMTLHMGLGRGPVDEIKTIKVGDKVAWPLAEGSSGAPDAGIFDDRVTQINAGNLFGGDKSEGGIKGTLTVCMGRAAQIFPSWVKAMIGGRVPDFRGVCTVVYDGLICSLNPYPKTWKWRIRRTHQGWDGPVWQPDFARIVLYDPLGNDIAAMNPAHILYECATNRDWGRGLPRTFIDEAAWLKAAQTLYYEGFGLCIRWNREDKLDSFVQDVIAHIGAAIYTDRETGLLTLKLFRADYDENQIPTFDYNSGLLSVEEDETSSQSNAITEVIVTYHDPISDEDRQTRAQNLGLMQASDAPNTSSPEYRGAPTFDIASRLAQRDLKAQSAQIKRYNIELDRVAWRIAPGAVFKISAPDKGIVNAILRAGKISEGEFTEGKIKVEAVLDVFGLASASFVQQEPPQWQPPDPTAQVVFNRIVREATYFDMFRSLSPADLALVDMHSGAIATIGAKPSVLMLSYNIATRTGTDDYATRGSEIFAPFVLLSEDIDFYDESVTFEGGVDLGLIEIGTLAQILNEIVLVTAVALNDDNVSGTLTIKRGCLDTVPEPHVDGSKLYFLNQAVGTDGVEYASGELVNVKLLSHSSSSELDVSLAPTDNVSIVGRQGRPYPPANVLVNSTPAFNNATVGTSFKIDWAHRDRLIQKDQIVSHTDSSVGPEAGTTYNLRFYTSSNVLLREMTGLTASSANFTAADNDLTGTMWVELESKRDGLTSFQKCRFKITRTP